MAERPLTLWAITGPKGQLLRGWLYPTRKRARFWQITAAWTPRRIVKVAVRKVRTR